MEKDSSSSVIKSENFVKENSRILLMSLYIRTEARSKTGTRIPAFLYAFFRDQDSSVVVLAVSEGFIWTEAKSKARGI